MSLALAFAALLATPALVATPALLATPIGDPPEAAQVASNVAPAAVDAPADSATTLRASLPATAPATRPSDQPFVAVEGLYPLWEQTGTLDAPGAARVGWGHAAVGLGRVSLATQPFLDLYGTANASVKLSLHQGARLSAALVVGGYRLPTAAEERGIGSVNMSKFANPFAPVWLVPVSAALTAVVTPRLHLHASATALSTRSSAAAYEGVSGGLAGFCEWFASPSRSVRLHAGAEGWPTWTQEHVGLSFAWRFPHVALAAGYARRFNPGGTSDSVFLWDAGLLFP
jgi:hypothetical protein